MEIWTKDYALKKLAPSTYYRYKHMLETRITPYFGHYKLNKIKPTDIMRFYDLLEEDTQIIRRKNNNRKKTRKPLSQKTILEHHRLLSAMLHKAVYWQLIVSNPAERVQPPKTSKPLRRHYDEDQTKILVDNLQKLKGNQIKYRTAILLDIFTGARLGELVGLEWSDIDFKNKIIHVTGTLTEIAGKAFKDTPKTKTSRRDIPMLDNVERIFLKRKEEQKIRKAALGDKYKGKEGLENLIFKSGRGTPVSNSCYVRMLNRAVEKINNAGMEFEHVHPHTLRHTFATRCIENGMPPQVLKAILGHSSLAMTMDLYAHVLPDTKAEEMKKIAGLF